MEKQGFQLKADFNAFETAGGDGKLIRLEQGDTYHTSDPFEIALLSDAHAVKRAESSGKKEK